MLASLYLEIGAIQLEQGKFELAKDNLLHSIKLAEGISPKVITGCFNNLGFFGI